MRVRAGADKGGLVALLILSFLCILGIAPGAGAQGPSEPGSPPVRLTLEQAIALGLKASPAMQRAQLRRDLAALELRRAEVNVRATVTPLELEEARKRKERADHEVQLQRVQTALDVERLYYGVLRAEDTLALRQNATERAVRQLDIARRRHASGQVTDLQLREVEQGLLAAELAEKEAEQALQLAWMRLRQTLGIGEDVPLELEPMIAVDDDVLQEDGVAEAEARRFEVIWAKQALEDARRAVELADNDYTPRVELERAQIALAEAELALSETLNSIRLEVWNAALALKVAEGRYELALEKQDLAAAQLDLAELRYHNGLNTVLDVLNAQSALAAAEVEVVAAYYDYSMARAVYLQAIGRGFDRWPELLEDEAGGGQDGGSEESFAVTAGGSQ